jgi:hypothetical protein
MYEIDPSNISNVTYINDNSMYDIPASYMYKNVSTGGRKNKQKRKRQKLARRINR